jgi:thiosulfate sulfurtransferase
MQITSIELAALKGQITLIDVRRDAARVADGTQLVQSQWRNPAQWLDWKDTIDTAVPVVFYCAHGKELSQAMTTALRVMGADARYLAGGIAQWKLDHQAVETFDL